MRRRTFLGSAAFAAGAAAAGPARAAAMRRSIWLYDPALPATHGLAAKARAAGSEIRAVAGDRVRFAQATLTESPQRIAGVTRYADFLLIAGVAVEAGYRVTSQATLTGGAAIGWALTRR